MRIRSLLSGTVFLSMVNFRSNTFFYFLVGVLSLVIILSTWALSLGRWGAALPLVISLPVLCVVWIRHDWTRPIVNMWAVAMMAGGYGFFSGRTSVLTTYSGLGALLMGAAVCGLSKTYIWTREEVEI